MTKAKSTRLVADILGLSASTYVKTFRVLSSAHRRNADSDRAAGNTARDIGATGSSELALAKAAVEMGQVSAPEPVIRALNELHYSLAMMTTAETYDDLLELPLVPAEQIKAELESPEAKAWFKAALAEPGR